MKHFRTKNDDSLRRIGFELQDQAYDHVFKGEERRDIEFRNVCEYVARNPERGGHVGVDDYAKYPFSGCLVPGYPEQRPFEDGYWEQFNKIVSYLRDERLMRA